jgi:hypothetical protein
MKIRPVQSIDFYGEPVATRRRCVHCNQHLGSANPGDTCSTCKWISQGSVRMK